MMKRQSERLSTGNCAEADRFIMFISRVTDIADVALRIAKLVPDARVDFAHGQMSERELENVMYSFVNGGY